MIKRGAVSGDGGPRVQLRILADDGPGGRGKLAAITTGHGALYSVQAGRRRPATALRACVEAPPLAALHLQRICLGEGCRMQALLTPRANGRPRAFFGAMSSPRAPRIATPLRLQTPRPCAPILDGHCQYRDRGRGLGAPRCFMRVSSLRFHCAYSATRRHRCLCLCRCICLCLCLRRCLCTAVPPDGHAHALALALARAAPTAAPSHAPGRLHHHPLRM
jgi:hypothetical protein